MSKGYIVRGKKVLILEKNNRIGGQIRTLEKDGFVFETGTNTGSVSHPEVAELFDALSPACELENADENAKHRLIWKGDHFRELSGGLLSGLTTPVIHKEKEQEISAGHTKKLPGGKTGPVFYGVTALYFETDSSGELRERGFSMG